MFEHSCCAHHRSFPTRRFVLAGLACAALAPKELMAQAAVASKDDERYMRMAIDEARRADFPFGAVIVKDGRILARGRNLGRSQRDPTAHGEMVAIRRAILAFGGGILRGATLYTSGEPCAMCMGAILWCHMGRVVFAASLEQLATVIDQIMITAEDLAARAKFAPIEIKGGVMADEAMALFKKKT